MKNIHKTVKGIAIIAFLFLLISAMILSAVFKNSNYVFAEESMVSVKLEAETSALDTDIIVGSNLTIRDYPQQLHATEAAVRITDQTDIGFELYNLDEDDPIVNIVPKDYFFTVCNVVNMGDEYGYFINTIKTLNNTYLSTVLVFDITTNTDLVATTDRVIVEVSPVFQYKYAGLTNDANMALFNGFYLNYDMLYESRVVAYPSNMAFNSLFHKVEYNMTEEYYIKDVSFGATLYNEQAPNYDDGGYDPYNDFGSYFTGFDYSYHGKYREHEEFNTGAAVELAADTVMCILGIAKKLPVLGTVYSVVSLTKGWLDFGTNIYKNVVGEVKSIEKKITATCFYQNRDDQLKYYRDENNNPFLIKNAIIALDTGNEKSIWYGVGDNVTAYFNVGHSAMNGRTPYYTRFTDQLALQIVSSDGDTTVAAGSTIIHDNLREPEIKELEFLGSGDIYLLSEGEDHLVYDNLMYESDYTVNITLTDNATVNVNGQVQTGKNLRFNIHAEEYDDIVINLGNNNVQVP